MAAIPRVAAVEGIDVEFGPIEHVHLLPLGQHLEGNRVLAAGEVRVCHHLLALDEDASLPGAVRRNVGAVPFGIHARQARQHAGGPAAARSADNCTARRSG